jgi:hypothetical protein
VSGLIHSRATGDGASDTALELVGVDTPFSSQVLESIDRRLGIDAARNGRAALARSGASEERS